MSNSRRQFMIAGAACASALTVGGCQTAQSGSGGSGPIGLQLFTLREMFAADPHGTLEKVAAVGYREIEFGGGGYEAMDHAGLRRTMDRIGLRAPSIHVGYDLLLDRFDKSVGMAHALGAETVVLPYMTNAFYGASAWAGAVENFNRFAGKLKAAGLGFAYHNHDFEFTQKPGGISLWDRFMRERNRDLVRLQLDLYWVVRAGGDPGVLIRSLPGQIHSYHVKDLTQGGTMAAVGTGTIDFAGIFTLNELSGVQHFYVENDMAQAPWLPDITTSFTHLSRLLAGG